MFARDYCGTNGKFFLVKADAVFISYFRLWCLEISKNETPTKQIYVGIYEKSFKN